MRCDLEGISSLRAPHRKQSDCEDTSQSLVLHRTLFYTGHELWHPYVGSIQPEEESLLSQPILPCFCDLIGLPWCLSSKESTCNAADAGSIPGLGRSPAVGNGNPLQYSYLGSPTERGDWWATEHVITESWTGFRDETATNTLLSMCVNLLFLKLYLSPTLLIFLCCESIAYNW